MNIIWLLGANPYHPSKSRSQEPRVPKSIYDIKKTKYVLPSGFAEPTLISYLDGWREKAKKPITYHYSFILETVRKLQKKGLVQTTRDASGKHMRRIVRLTFPGLMLYLRNSEDANKIERAIQFHSTLLPFSSQWETMTKLLGAEKCKKAFEGTLKSFHSIQKTRFRMTPLKMEFEGYLTLADPLGLSSNGQKRHRLVRDAKVAEYLRSSEARVLRNSYIAYLIANDIKRLYDKHSKLDKLPRLKSEEEYAFFEKTDLSPHPVFREGRIKDFVPKYLRFEYFFTGMFVENLLWKRVKVERPKETKHDFEVEYI